MVVNMPKLSTRKNIVAAVMYIQYLGFNPSTSKSSETIVTMNIISPDLMITCFTIISMIVRNMLIINSSTSSL